MRSSAGNAEVRTSTLASERAASGALFKWNAESSSIFPAQLARSYTDSLLSLSQRCSLLDLAPEFVRHCIAH